MELTQKAAFACGSMVLFFFNVRTYAAGVFSLRQSGTLLFNCVRFSALRAENRTQKIGMYHAAAGDKARFEMQRRNCVTPKCMSIFRPAWRKIDIHRLRNPWNAQVLNQQIRLLQTLAQRGQEAR